MKYILSAFALGLLSIVVFNFTPESETFGAPTVVALEGTEAVGIIVKNGTKMDTLLAAYFVIDNFICDPSATSTPQEMCEQILFEGRPVKVYYTADDNMAGKQSFNDKLGAFPFAGRIDYVNRSQPDIEPKLIQFMLEQGNGSYSIIHE